tara:strand:- start:31 stop:339 length:309 start_codon:yes stop_codon:yes gene_type:complete
MEKVQLQIADIETATHLKLVTTIYQDQIVTTIKKSEKKNWISRMDKGLKLTGLIFQTRFLPKTVFITDIDDKDYTFESNEERIRKHEEATELLKNSQFGVSN